MPRLYFASPRDLPLARAIPGVTRHVLQTERTTVAITDYEPKTVIETHKHDAEQTGVVVKGSVVFVIAGEQRILTPGDTYRVPSGASHGARILEAAARVIEVWSPPREDLPKAT
ncbi:MAG: cupin domain-containing protein [Chloroflexi bacterium]|nr:cupin domain-containing protein [Chloroflexota bacterium]